MSHIIIGGGISGLVAAYYLLKRGDSVSLFDNGKPGGVILSEKRGGFLLEHGPNVLLEREELSRLITELGLRDEVVYPAIDPYDQFIWHKGRPEKVPKGPVALLKTPLLDPSTKLSLIPKVIAGKFPRLNNLEDISVKDFFYPILGETGCNVLLEGALRGIYGGDIERLSASFLFPNLFKSAKQGLPIRSAIKKERKPKIFTFKGGIQTLTDALRKEVSKSGSIHSEKIEAIMSENSGFSVKTGSSTIKAKNVWISTCGVESSPLLQSIAPEVAMSLSEVKYVHLSIAHVSIDKANIPAWLSYGFGVLFPNEEKIMGIMTNSILFPHVAPSNRALLTLMFSSPSNIEEEVRSTLNNFLPGARGEILSIVHWPRALPKYLVGHNQLVELLQKTEKLYPGLHFIGRDIGKPSVSDRVRSIQEKIALAKL